MPAIKQAIKINEGKVVGVSEELNPISINRNIKRNSANLLILAIGKKRSTCKLISDIKHEHPLIRIVIIATDCLIVQTAIKARMVEAVITINECIEDLVQAIFLAKHGQEYYPQEKSPEMTTGVIRLNLTDRERQIFDLLEKCLSKPEIALTLKISIKTVRTHVRNLNAKLGTNY